MLAAFRQRNFALLWVGGLVSGLGDWFLFIALPFFVYQLTGSALATGGMFIAETLPSILFGSLAGVFVDRWDRRRTMVVSDLSRAVVLPALLLVRSPESVWIVFVASFVQSSIGQFFGPARSALIPRLVSDDELVAANSLSSISGELTRLIGPVLGGAMLGLFGLASVVLADSTSFLFSAVMVGLIALAPATDSSRGRLERGGHGGRLDHEEHETPRKAREKEASASRWFSRAFRGVSRYSWSRRPGGVSRYSRSRRPGRVSRYSWPRRIPRSVAESPHRPVAPSPVAAVWREFREGVVLMRQSRLVSTLLLVMGICMLGQGIINVMLIPFVKDVLHGDALVLGWVASAQGIGGLIGGLAIGRIGHGGSPAHLVALGLAACGVLVVAIVNVTWLPLVLLLIAVAGLATVAFAVSLQTLLQTSVADQYRGRIFGAYGTIQSTLLLIGMGLASALGGVLGTVPLLDVAGAFMLAAGLVALASLPGAVRETPVLEAIKGEA